MKKMLLDDEERDILESYERGEWVPVKNSKKEIKRLRSMQEIHYKKISG